MKYQFIRTNLHSYPVRASAVTPSAPASSRRVFAPAIARSASDDATALCLII
jgi:hypothetical protein